MSTVSFNTESFSSLSCLEYSSQWENIKLDQLFPDEAELVQGFLTLAKGDSDIELSDTVLLVKTNDDRLLEQVYGASIFRESEDGDGLVIKMGNNKFPINITEGRACLQVGYLKGSFLWLQKNRGDGTPYNVLTANLYDGRPESNADDVYEVACSLVTKDETINDSTGKLTSNPLFLTPPKLDRLLDAKAALGQFFSVAKSGGGSVFKMKDLGAHTEWRVVAVDESDPHPDYGISYILRLDGGASTFARGNSEVICRKQLKMIRESLAKGDIWTLKIGVVEEYAPGKTKVNNALVRRAPSLNGSSPKPIAQARPQLAAASTQRVFGADYGNAQEGKEWAIKQGLSSEQADEIKSKVDAIADKKKEAGETMTPPQRRLAFMAFVKELVAQSPTTTIDVDAVEGDAEDDIIPF
jgi:hypothetical protein